MKEELRDDTVDSRRPPASFTLAHSRSLALYGLSSHRTIEGCGKQEQRRYENEPTLRGRYAV